MTMTIDELSAILNGWPGAAVSVLCITAIVFMFRHAVVSISRDKR